MYGRILRHECSLRLRLVCTNMLPESWNRPLRKHPNAVTRSGQNRAKQAKRQIEDREMGLASRRV